MAAYLDSHKVCVKSTSETSEGLFTCESVNEGDTILTEQPIISSQFSWNKQYNYTACHHCMKSLETAQNMGRRLAGNYGLELPHTGQCCMSAVRQPLLQKCSKCDMQFCCDECLVEANEKYHQCLCSNADQVKSMEDTWRQMHYPPEKTTIMLLVRIVATILQSSEDGKKLTDTLDQFMLCNEKVEENVLQELLGEQYKKKLNELYSCLKNCMPIERYSKLSTCAAFSSFLASIVRNGQVIRTSSLTGYVHNIDALELSETERQMTDEIIDQMYQHIGKESGEFINCEGVGLFPLQSKCKHSCTPNAEISFPYNDNTLVLTTLQDIQCGEEICISYLDECQQSRSRQTRQRLLWQNFAYVCSCSRCEIDASGSSEGSSDECEGEDGEGS